VWYFSFYERHPTPVACCDFYRAINATCSRFAPSFTLRTLPLSLSLSHTHTPSPSPHRPEPSSYTVLHPLRPLTLRQSPSNSRNQLPYPAPRPTSTSHRSHEFPAHSLTHSLAYISFSLSLSLSLSYPVSIITLITKVLMFSLKDTCLLMLIIDYYAPMLGLSIFPTFLAASAESSNNVYCLYGLNTTSRLPCKITPAFLARRKLILRSDILSLNLLQSFFILFIM
jgi:hypothetical protein